MCLKTAKHCVWIHGWHYFSWVDGILGWFLSGVTHIEFSHPLIFLPIPSQSILESHIDLLRMRETFWWKRISQCDIKIIDWRVDDWYNLWERHKSSHKTPLLLFERLTKVVCAIIPAFIFLSLTILCEHSLKVGMTHYYRTIQTHHGRNNPIVIIHTNIIINEI